MDSIIGLEFQSSRAKGHTYSAATFELDAISLKNSSSVRCRDIEEIGTNYFC